MASADLLASPWTPRRATSMPTTPTRSLSLRAPSFGFSQEKGHGSLLPLTNPSSPSSVRNVRSTARRLSYTVKARASRYAYPLSISGLLALGFLYYTYVHSHSAAWGGPWQGTNGGKLHIYARDSQSPVKAHIGYTNEPHRGDSNGLSLLTEADEDELIAEDDLYWSSYKEPTEPTMEEAAAAEEIKAHKLDVQHHNRVHVLESLVWWLAEGGILPSNFKTPTKEAMMKKSGSGLEKILADVDNGEEETGIFQEGWADYTQKQYRVVVFSKSYCPFSKRAKRILESYALTPAPFIIELDQRSDMEALQSLLQRMTGRRTVPNVLIDFESIGGADEIALLHGEGGLQRKFEEAGMLPGSKRRYSPAKIAKPVAAVAPVVAKIPEEGKADKAVHGKEGDVRRPGSWGGRAPEKPAAVKREAVDGRAVEPVVNTQKEREAENEAEEAEALARLQAKLVELESLALGHAERTAIEALEAAKSEETAEAIEGVRTQQPLAAPLHVDNKRDAARR